MFELFEADSLDVIGVQKPTLMQSVAVLKRIIRFCPILYSTLTDLVNITNVHYFNICIVKFMLFIKITCFIIKL